MILTLAYLKIQTNSFHIANTSHLRYGFYENDKIYVHIVTNFNSCKSMTNKFQFSENN